MSEPSIKTPLQLSRLPLHDHESWNTQGATAALGSNAQAHLMVPQGLCIKPLLESELDTLLDIEQTTYSNPWTRGNFADALKHGNWCDLLWQDRRLLGYFVAMKGHQEVHLLNLTVHKDCRAQGLGLLLLNVLLNKSLAEKAQWIWLEVRVSNVRAIAVYERFGFRTVGERKNYYPLTPGVRENAMIMSMRL
jgi:ribosomal-protein-alanine N-acetyltransferase